MTRRWIAGLLLGAACLAAGAEERPLFEQIVERARTLAGSPYQGDAQSELPPGLEDLDYQGYRAIRFQKERALWPSDAGFQVELFHPGFLYRHPVIIHEVVEGQVRRVDFDSRMFDYGRHGALDLPEDLGFAGFRFHYPVHDPKYKDEIAAFLGASYFRMVGRGQHYGLSARGLAVNTALPSGEEFPRFTEFWLVRPDRQSNRVEFFALLDSESVTGAYAFELVSSLDTVLNVQARLFARSDVEKLGVAPLTSMFAWGENTADGFDDYRPEVHDSDGLVHHTGSGEWIWRVLTNPPSLQVSTLLDTGLKGFGLAQRDRAFSSYQDPESRYERRPGIWVSPGPGDWGKGAVHLVEIPTSDETNDNIVAFWVDDRPLKAGQSRRFDYQLRTFESLPNPDGLARVKGTRNGWGWVPGSPEKPARSVRQFVVDFHGGELTRQSGDQPVRADLSVERGEARTLTVAKIPDTGLWRVAFKLHPGDLDQKVNMRLFLELRGRRISETWNYLWDPAAVGGG